MLLKLSSNFIVSLKFKPILYRSKPELFDKPFIYTILQYYKAPGTIPYHIHYKKR